MLHLDPRFKFDSSLLGIAGDKTKNYQNLEISSGITFIPSFNKSYQSVSIVLLFLYLSRRFSHTRSFLRVFTIKRPKKKKKQNRIKNMMGHIATRLERVHVVKLPRR
jgi:hypothetical protein